MVVMDVHRRPSVEWQKDESVSVMTGRECECRGWVGVRGKKRVRNVCPWRRRVAVLESHRGQVGHRNWRGMVGRSGITHIGWYHHCDLNASTEDLGHCWKDDREYVEAYIGYGCDQLTYPPSNLARVEGQPHIV